MGLGSKSDGFQGLREFKFMRLLSPVSEFIRELRKEQGRNPDYIVSCKADTKLRDVVDTVTAERVHRIFVVDGGKQAGSE